MGLRAHAWRGWFSARGNLGFVGLENWKVGRTAAFAAWASSVMVRTKKAGPEAGALSVTLGFEIHTAENV